MIRFRRIDESTDRELLDKWISEDPDHREKSQPEFWLNPTPDRSESFVIEDERGPIFFVRAENLLRLHIQFAPQSEKRRLVKAIDEFTSEIKQLAKPKYQQIIFDSTSASLINFLSKRGFYHSPDEYVYDIPKDNEE